jgi:hypothetical protein
VTTLKDIGSPIPWSDSDLDALSQVTPADAKAAQVLWERDAPPALKGLFSAQPAEPDA